MDHQPALEQPNHLADDRKPQCEPLGPAFNLTVGLDVDSNCTPDCKSNRGTDVCTNPPTIIRTIIVITNVGPNHPAYHHPDCQHRQRLRSRPC